jgi:FixJ family two-component response regulator
MPPAASSRDDEAFRIDAGNDPDHRRRPCGAKFAEIRTGGGRLCGGAYPTGAELLSEANLPDNGCLVVDYKLPEMNGLDLLSELRRRNIDLPAILITTHPNPAVRNRAALAGVPLIEKPLLNDTLFQGIRSALGRSAPRH